jgi:hypothetical protein
MGYADKEYNPHTQHIRGADNFLADTISRNPAGLCERDTKELFKLKELMEPTINLGTDNSVGKSLKRVSDVPSLRQNNPRNNPNCGAETKRCQQKCHGAKRRTI